MDFATFKEKLLNDDLKSLPTPQRYKDSLGKKYKEIEITGTYKLSDTMTAVYFKHKLWHKLAIFHNEEWKETRINSLKNKLPDEAQEQLLKNLGKGLTILSLESVIPVDEAFFYYIIAKISGKKYVLHVSKEGEVILKSKFMEYSIHLDDEDEEESASSEIDENAEELDDLDDLDEVEEIAVEVESDEEDMD